MTLYPYASTHIENLTPEIVRAVIENPEVTYEDLDALEFSVINSDMPGMGSASPLIEEISEAIRGILYRE